jgi:outer membrane protein assembly factor BamA
MNYFGMGKESTKDDSFNDSYYRLNVNQLILNYALGYRWGKSAFREMKEGKINQSEVRLGVFLKRSHIEEQKDHFISDLEHNGLIKDDLYPLLFSGIYGQYSYSNLDREVNPQRGYQLDLSGEQFFQLNHEQDHFLRLNADFRTYISFTKRPRAVLALRAGGSKIFGDYAFLEAAKLGGKTNLRGYLSDRFYGHGSVYQNSEFRYKLLDFSSYILNGELGVLAFYDSGRVWVKNEDSDHWHQGYGSGFWLSPFEMTIFTATYNWSSEDKMLQVTLNFKF